MLPLKNKIGFPEKERKETDTAKFRKTMTQYVFFPEKNEEKDLSGKSVQTACQTE